MYFVQKSDRLWYRLNASRTGYDLVDRRHTRRQHDLEELTMLLMLLHCDGVDAPVIRSYDTSPLARHAG